MQAPNASANSLTRRVSPVGLCLIALVAVAGSVVSLDRAQAQNLVQNPDFTTGFTYYTVCCNVTTQPDGNGGVIAILPLGSTLSQAIATTPNSTYIVSFIASFTNSGTYTATFGNGSLIERPTSATNPATFTFSGLATSATTSLTFTTGDNNGIEHLSNLDVGLQGAPAPTLGAGFPSIAAALIALSWTSIRRTVRKRNSAA